MSLENQLHVEEDKGHLKNAAGEKQKNFVKPAENQTVDGFIKTIKKAAEDKKKEKDISYKTDIKQAKSEKTNKIITEKIISEHDKTEKAEVEIATIDAFLKNSPAIVNIITTNLLNNFEKIGASKEYSDITVFENAKNAFDNDILEFKASQNYNKKTMDATMLILETDLKSLQNQIDLKKIEEKPAYADNFDKTQIEILEKLAISAGENLKTKIPTALETKRSDELINTLTTKKNSLETTETSTLETILSKTATDAVAKELFETNESAWNALMEKKGVPTDATQKANLAILITKYVTKLHPGTKSTKFTFETYATTNEHYLQATNNEGKVVDIKFGKTSDTLHQARADNNTYTRSRGNKVETTKTETLTFLGGETLVDKTGIITEAGSKKTINEVIDITKTPPAKINITTAGVKTEATLVTLLDKTQTYVATVDAKKTDLTITNSIKITTGDKIEAVLPEKTAAVETAEDKVSLGKKISAMDAMGSYREFEDVIDAEPDKVAFLKKALAGGILDAIDDDANHGTTDQIAKKNGYYGIIIEQIAKTKDQGLLDTYLGKIIVDGTINVKYLGTDNANQMTNFDKLQKNWTIDATSETGIKLKSIEDQLLLGVDKKTLEETLNNSVNTIFSKYGDFLFKVLKMLGFNRAKLTKMFGAEKVNGIYAREYGLSDTKKEAINAIVSSKASDGTTENFSSIKPTTTDGADIRLKTGEDMEKQFDTKTKEKYADLMVTEGYYKNMDVGRIKVGLALYNKESKKDLKIADIITLKTDEEGKEYVEGIVDKKETEFKGIMTSILNNDATRTKIASANESIKTPALDGEKTTAYNEQGLEIATEISTYLISTQQDIARYLTASLFSKKDLSFVMTENKLNNGEIQTTTKDIDKTVVEKPKEVLTFLGGETLVDSKTGIVTTLGGAKKIHEIIDTSSATTTPTKINITTAKGVTTEATLVTLTDKTKTYVPTKNATKTDLTIADRIQFVAGDKITLVETVKTDAEKYTENKDKLIAGEKNIITTGTEKKYKTFVYEKDFIYNATATGDQKEYQDNMLIPEKNIITDSKQFPLYIIETGSTEKTTSADSMVHLANTLSMIDAGNTTKAYTSAITNLKTAGATFSMVGNTDKNTVIITSKDKGIITLSQTTTGDKTILNAKREPTTPVKI